MPSLILGIIAIVSLWFTLGISGLVCGIIGVALAKKNKDQYKTTVGFVLSLVSIIISAIVLVVMIAMIALVGALGFGLASMFY